MAEGPVNWPALCYVAATTGCIHGDDNIDVVDGIMILLCTGWRINILFATNS